MFISTVCGANTNYCFPARGVILNSTLDDFSTLLFEILLFLIDSAVGGEITGLLNGMLADLITCVWYKLTFGPSKINKLEKN